MSNPGDDSAEDSIGSVNSSVEGADANAAPGNVNDAVGDEGIGDGEGGDGTIEYTDQEWQEWINGGWSIYASTNPNGYTHDDGNGRWRWAHRRFLRRLARGRGVADLYKRSESADSWSGRYCSAACGLPHDRRPLSGSVGLVALSRARRR